MNTNNIEKNKTGYRKRHMPICSGVYPGDGFVAWPDDKRPLQNEKATTYPVRICRGNQRKGFVALPEKNNA